MLLLQGNGITQVYEDTTIFEDVGFSLYNGDRVGLIGINGCGKTTFMRTLIGELEPYRGHVKAFGRLGYLSQDLKLPKGLRVYDYLNPYQDYPDYSMILSRLNLWQHIDQCLENLSGGEKTRLFLAKLMLDRPEVLLLDEPTNHLDKEGIELLSKFLNAYAGAVLIVSHDRHFLDQTVNQIVRLEDGQLRLFGGNYTQYRIEIENEEQIQWLSYERYLRKKEQLEAAASLQKNRAGKYNKMSQNDFQRGKARKIAKVAKSIEKRVDMLEKVERPKTDSRFLLYMTSFEGVSSKFLVRAENLKISYGTYTIIKGVNFQVKRGSRVGLMGSNGSGKSTLLKAILGEVPHEGQLKVSASGQIGYFSQELNLLDPEKTLLETMADLGLKEVDSRRFLGTMNFARDLAFKKIKTLSYGEKSRVAFLKLVLGGYNLLLLDEPTNFLDIPTREKIESLLEPYEGTLIFVSHDEFFMKKMATEIWRLEEGQLKAIELDALKLKLATAQI